MNSRQRQDLDRHITGNYGEDSVPAEPDVRIENHGTIFRFELLTDKAREWVDESVKYDGYQMMGNALCVEHRYAGDLAAGMREAGLEVE